MTKAQAGPRRMPGPSRPMMGHHKKILTISSRNNRSQLAKGNVLPLCLNVAAADLATGLSVSEISANTLKL